MDSIKADATETPPPVVVETEEGDEDSTNIRATAGGDIMPSVRQSRARIGTPSTSSTNSAGFISPGRGGGSGGRLSMTRSTGRLSILRRESSDCGGSEGSSKRGGSTRKLLRESSMGTKGSSASAFSFGSSVSANSEHAASVTAFLKAAGEGDKRAAMKFLNSGGDVNAKSKTGTSTALSRAAAKGHVNIVTLLLGHGAAVNMPGRGGLTPLHEAAGCGQVEVCQVLLGVGAAAAARDHSNRCPLHYASNSLGLTKLLLNYGADPNAKDKNGQRPDMISMNPEARALLRDARVAVREYAVGDNASRVIASLRRELENMEHEAQAAKESAADQAKWREQLELGVVQLRDQNSALSQKVEYHKKEAAAARTARINRSTAQIPDTAQAELRQLRASLRVARAAAAEEKRRRLSLEKDFDENVAEAVAKAIAAAATRLLDRMPPEAEEEGKEDQESGIGDAVCDLCRRWESDPQRSAVEHPGDGDANLPEPVRALPVAARAGGEEGGDRGNEHGVEDASAANDADKEEAQGGDQAKQPLKGWYRLFCLPSPRKHEKML